MPFKKLQFRPGIQKEVTAYSAEGGWTDGDRIRFRKGFPESIGGWRRYVSQAFLGVCRSITEWSTLGGVALLGFGTNLKYYVARGGEFADITPLRSTTGAGDVTFAASNGSTTLTITDTAHGAQVGEFVTFSGAVSLGGTVTAAVLNTNHQIFEVLSGNSYTVVLAAAANASDVGNGGASVVAAYQIPVGGATQEAGVGWGAGAWSEDEWGIGGVGSEPLRIWNHSNYGEDLIFGPRGGPLYYFDVSAGVSSANPGVLITGSDVPVVHNVLLVSDVSRFVIALGCNELGSGSMDPMLVRWADQEDYTNWSPAITNQAGGQRLSNGSRIVGAKQSRQEILIWTDTALYSMQYVGPDAIWAFQLLGENTSIVSPQAVALAQGVAYWMGGDKFYKYDGRVQTLECDLRRFVFQDFNFEQADQVVCSTNEGFSEIWWFYPAASSHVPDKYVVFNYEQNIWYHGNMTRTAWLDSRLRGNPVAATDTGFLLDHEVGTDNGAGDTLQPLNSRITSAPVDIDDGTRFALVNRMLPDITFNRSTASSPRVTMTIFPMKSSGQGRSVPASLSGASVEEVVRAVAVPVEQYTSQVNFRVRGRQMVLQIDAENLGVAWQLGSPRVDMVPSGRRG
jgi:hypothetical protein